MRIKFTKREKIIITGGILIIGWLLVHNNQLTKQLNFAYEKYAELTDSITGRI